MGKVHIMRDFGGLKGLCLIEPMVFEDNRGFLKEVYNKRDLTEEGINTEFVQDNEAYNKAGVLRGFHVNLVHPQAKFIHVLSGEIYDVAIDLRKDSLTYKKWIGVKLSGTNHKSLYIPEGFGHGYLALTDAYIHFKVTTYWVSGDEIGFAWNSKEFNIDWPNDNPIQNDNDKNSPDFSELSI